MNMYEMIKQLEYDYSELLQGGDWATHHTQIENTARDILKWVEKYAHHSKNNIVEFSRD